jgi:2-amino-4-hydroxy-6-hydroxymethyldihydropteridine diphosphokinase
MIIVALGSNMPGPWGQPRDMVQEALIQLNHFPLKLVTSSQLIETPPFGRENQPNFVNALAVLETHLSPQSLLWLLHKIERKGGRQRGLRWGPRTLDLDLLDYHGRILNQPRQQLSTLVLPHPGITYRKFILAPLREIAPAWKHPVTHQSAQQLLLQLREV